MPSRRSSYILGADIQAWLSFGFHPQQRSARQYLIDRGVDENRLLAMGFGEQQLINDCVDNHPCNNQRHLVNRRTEFRLIYMDQNQVVSNY